MKWLMKLLGKVECRACSCWTTPSRVFGNVCSAKCLSVIEKKAEIIQDKKEKDCKKHNWSHKGWEWFEAVDMKTGKFFGRYSCTKCGKVDNFRPLKRMSGEAVARASEERRVGHKLCWSKP